MSIESKFNDNVVKLLNDFPNYPNGTYDLTKEMKGFMYSDLNNPFVKSFIKRLATRYIRLFTNQELINSFILPKSYYRQIKIYSNLPTTINPNYDTYLFNLFNFSSYNFYDMCKELLELAEVNVKDLEDVIKIIDRCADFEKENKTISKSSKSEYLSVEEEIKNIEEVKKQINSFNGNNLSVFGELIQAYAFGLQTNDLEYAAHSYLRKKTGNLGEYYSFDYLKGFDYSKFVSKDLNDGFGYDLYFLDDGIETLVEVKTTVQNIDDENDYFKLTQNEFRVLRESLTKNTTKYLVARIELDDKYKLNKIVVLETIDGITFTSRNISDITYRFSEFNKDGEAIFEKAVQKIKN